MATIDNKEMIDNIINTNGRPYEEDPQIISITEYTNAHGNVTWGVVWENDRNPERYLLESEYIRNAKRIWTWDGKS